MPSSQAEWEMNYRATGPVRNDPPAGIVQELLPLLPRTGRALDVACGAGRHSVLLAASGYSVTAVDWSAAAIELVEKSCQNAGVQSRRVQSLEALNPARQQGIQLLEANLEQLSLAPDVYDVIVCVNYLQRSFFSEFVRGLRPRGFLIFETFTQAQLEFSGGPRNSQYLLNCGELRDAFPGLDLTFYRELRAGQGVASLLAQKRMVQARSRT
jgi:tellurite methyltransferase